MVVQRGGSEMHPAGRVMSSAVVPFAASEVFAFEAREDASDSFWPLFPSPPFIRMCSSSRHQSRFLTVVLFRR